MFFNKLLKPAVLTIACAAALTAGSFGNVSFFHEAHAQTSQLSGLPDFTKLVEDNGKAVVSISTVKKAKRLGPQNGVPDEQLEMLRRFGFPFPFGDFNGPGMTPERRGQGSGFIIDPNGIILTNNHVVDGADEVTVHLTDKREFKAKVIGTDPKTDIAVIKIEAADLPAVTLGNSEELNVGDHVLAIGNPLGELTFSMSGGMVSSVNRTINVDGTPFNMIQTDTSINPGNSGEVVGIVSAKYSSYGTSGESVEGLGFAIPINDVSSMIQDIMTNGYVSNRAYLGATIGTLNASMAQQYRYDITEGAFVYSVEDGGPADQAGLQLGDVITAIDDTEITSLDDLTAARKSYTAGDTCTLTVYRQGETITLQLTWGAAPAEQQAESQSQTQQDNSQSGGYIDPNDLFNYFFG